MQLNRVLQGLKLCVSTPSMDPEKEGVPSELQMCVYIKFNIEYFNYINNNDFNIKFSIIFISFYNYNNLLVINCV